LRFFGVYCILIVWEKSEDKVYLTSGSLPIAWKTIGVYGKLAIHLRKHDDSQWIKLISGIPAVGNTSYSHPLGDIKPSQYFIRIKQIGTTVKGKSGLFWIQSPLPQKPPEIRTLIIIWPKEGSRVNHEYGMEIYWRSSGLSGDVMISIHRVEDSWFKILCSKCDIGDGRGGVMITSQEVESDWVGHSFFIMVKHKETGIFRKSGVFEVY
jgi:hypothetical protein